MNWVNGGNELHRLMNHPMYRALRLWHRPTQAITPIIVMAWERMNSFPVNSAQIPMRPSLRLMSPHFLCSIMGAELV